MDLILLSLGLLALGALIALVMPGNSRRTSLVGMVTAVVGSILGLVASVPIIPGGKAVEMVLPWQIPYGSFHLGLDSLSAFFLLPIFLLGGLCAVYGYGYLRARQGQSLAVAWFSYNLLILSMALVVLARNGILFLVAWELMALSSYFLVVHSLVEGKTETPRVKEAGIVYLAATHLGTAFLLVMFILLGQASGSMEFADFSTLNGSTSLVFLCAVIGFGAKAGFFPLHVWLPEAHPVAPSHVSALMSGVMIKTGIYGILRILTLIGPPPAWWGWLLVSIGLTSGILGVLYALAQHNLKRLLAYHSVENIGIIALGLGLGLVGRAAGLPAMAAFGFAGALLHVLNHSLFKGLLFLAAGAVSHGTGTLDIEALGGLRQKMPWTAGLFLLGSVAICGLPPLNGFVSEFCIYLGALKGAAAVGSNAVPAAATVIAGLGLIGGLAAACFTKAYGVVFQGTARTEQADAAHEVGLALRIPMVIIAAACILVALGAWLILQALAPVISTLAGPGSGPALQAGVSPLRTIALIGLALTAGTLFLVLIRSFLLRHRTVTTGETWGCGYHAPSARMQYTASSYASPLTGLFKTLLGLKIPGVQPRGIHPQPTTFTSRNTDQARALFYAPVYRFLMSISARIRVLQAGRLQFYVLYITITFFILLTLLVWR